MTCFVYRLTKQEYVAYVNEWPKYVLQMKYKRFTPTLKTNQIQLAQETNNSSLFDKKHTASVSTMQT